MLLVDDSRVMRKAISMILTQEFDLIEAEDGEDGWAKITSTPEIQVIISDIEMPKLDGFGLLERLRNFEDVHINQMPVIIITGADDEETRQSALDQGATDFVTKPVDKTQLLARVRANARFTETKRDLEETAISLKSDSTFDPITGLSSRRFFLQRGEQDIAYAKRHGQDLALIRIDIDHFRRLYADYGDEAVDEILLWLAKLMKAHARIEDTVARVGGASFAVLAPATSPSEAVVLGERLRNAISNKPFQRKDASIPLTASAGLVTLNRHPESNIADLLKLSEEQLRQARRSGGNRIHSDQLLEPAAVVAPAPTQTVAKEPEAVPMDLDITATEDIAMAETALASPEAEQAVEVSAEVPTVEEAIARLASGETQQLDPYLWSLLTQFLPLLEHCNQKLDLGIGIATQVLRHKIENQDQE